MPQPKRGDFPHGFQTYPTCPYPHFFSVDPQKTSGDVVGTSGVTMGIRYAIRTCWGGNSWIGANMYANLSFFDRFSQHVYHFDTSPKSGAARSLVALQHA